MTRRLVPHWVALQHVLPGFDPWQAGEWTLDQALVLEVLADDVALSARVARAARSRR